jgi:hypothetical protein
LLQAVAVALRLLERFEQFANHGLQHGHIVGQ